MEYGTVIIVLLAIAIILQFVSFFIKEKKDTLHDEVSEYILQLSEEIYALKKRLDALEDSSKKEASDTAAKPNDANKKIGELTQKHIISLYVKGTSEAEIAEQLFLSPAAVKEITDAYVRESI